jgi:hypothetical protein
MKRSFAILGCLLCVFIVLDRVPAFYVPVRIDQNLKLEDGCTVISLKRSLFTTHAYVDGDHFGGDHYTGRVQAVVEGKFPQNVLGKAATVKRWHSKSTSGRMIFARAVLTFVSD